MKFIIFIYEKLAQKKYRGDCIARRFLVWKRYKKTAGEKPPPHTGNALIFDFVVNANKVHFKEVRQNCFE